jgi:hypothetical protein
MGFRTTVCWGWTHSGLRLGGLGDSSDHPNQVLVTAKNNELEAAGDR